MLKLHLIIKGHVQRVGFRQSVWQFVESEKLPVTGFVRNLPDGSVEIVAEGDIESLKRLHTFSKQGPSRASIREVTHELTEHPKKEWTRFSIES
jgi:acylphosphatase